MCSIALDPKIVLEGDYTQEKAYILVKELLSREKKITAIFCANDLMAFGALKAIKERGKRVPEDISVVGFDDMDMSSYIDPPLTTVRQPFVEIGKKAVEILLKQIEGGINRTKRYNLSGKFILRKSVGKPKN